jgi:hypothetical protein
LFLSLRLGLAAATFAMNLLLDRPQPFNICWRPKPDSSAISEDGLGCLDFAGTNPSLQRDAINADCLGGPLCRHFGVHATYVAYFY